MSASAGLPLGSLPLPSILHGQMHAPRTSIAAASGGAAHPSTRFTNATRPAPPLTSVTPQDAKWSALGGSSAASAAHACTVKDWSKQHAIHRMYECLMFALAVDRPDDARAYLIEKLKELRERGLVHWDMLIPYERRPPLPERPYWLFNDDPWDDDKPTGEMFVTAYTYNNLRLLRLGLRMWNSFVEGRRKEKEKILLKVVLAIRQRRRVVLSKIMLGWSSWSKRNIEQRQAVYERLVQRTRLRRMRPILRCWFSHTQNSKQAKLWFEKMSKGGGEEYLAGQQGDQFTRMLKWDHRVKIFSYLSVLDLCRCAQVCRAWQDVVQDRFLWESTNLSALSNRVEDTAIQSIVDKHFSVITHLNLLGCYKLTSSSCERLALCSNIQDLNLSGCKKIRDDGVRKIIQGCQCLLYLNLSFCKVSDLCLRDLGMYASELAFLSLANCTELTDAGAVALRKGTQCKKLQWLDLSGCRNFSSQGLQHLLEGVGNTLQALILNNITTLRSQVIITIGKTCTYLQHLSLLGCRNITDKALKGLSGCANLRRLCISDNDKITGVGVRGMARACKSLTNIVITRCVKVGNEGLMALAGCNLFYIDLSDCIALTDPGIRSLSEGILPRRNLQHLDLSRCNGITESGFFYICMRLTNITHLRLRDCRNLTDSSFECASELRRLEVLDISGCTKIGDETLILIGNTRRPTLRHVNVSGCSLIGDSGIEGLVKHCDGLFSMDVSFCNQLTYDAIYHLTFRNRHLHYLNLQGCTMLNNKIIPLICGCCTVLAHLNLFGLTQLTNEALEKYLKRCKGLQTMIITGGAHVTLDAITSFKRVRKGCRVYFEKQPPPAGYLPEPAAAAF